MTTESDMPEQDKIMHRGRCVEMANEWAMKNNGTTAAEMLDYANALYEYILNGKAAELTLVEGSKAA